MYRKLIPICMMLFIMGLPGTAGAKLDPGDFADIRGHWAEQEISSSCSLGLMNGTGVNEQGEAVFMPDGQVSRAQFATVLVRAFQLDYGDVKFVKEPAASDYYQDVNNQDWFADEVVLCAINGIFDSSSNFYPDRSVTRIEAARAIQRCFDAKGIVVPMIEIMPIYEDTSSLSQSDFNAVVFVSNTGIMKGNDGLFRPDEGVKRGELAKMMNRCVSMMNVNENYNNGEYTLKAGQSFTLSLASNPTTGYQWDFTNRGDDRLLALTGETYQSDSVSSGQVLVGQGGRDYWTFEAIQAGTTEISMWYARPWESVQPAQVFKLKVIIEAPAAADTGLTIETREIIEKSETLNIDLNIPVISGMADKSIQTVLNARLDKEAWDLQAELAAQIDEYVENAQEYGYTIHPYELVTRYQPCYQNERLLSLTVDYYQYTGGAHGMTARRAYNIDQTTGGELALKDLFTDNYDYTGLINEEIRRQIAINPEMYFGDPIGFNGISENQKYYIQNGNLVIYFDQYEIAPYAAGIPEFRVPFNLFQDGLKSDLLP